jgi:hypothetical protein
MKNSNFFFIVLLSLFTGIMACSQERSTTVKNTVASIKHVIVYKEPGKFCGWPANYGMWSWGNEIVVGFKLGVYKASKGHSIDQSKPKSDILARSIDGGETWSLEIPNEFNIEIDPVKLTEGIHFTHPDFAMTVRGERFFISYDRCTTWQGPYNLPEFDQIDIQARTDYIVKDHKSCLIFLTATKTNGKEGRPFCAQTSDCGTTIDFVSWIAPEPYGFSIMPSTVRLAENKLLTAIRRKEQRLGFLEVYQSMDEGKTWDLLSIPATTGRNNGNPPSMIRLGDRRIVLTYGYRSKPQGIRAKISRDNGETWGNEIILRNDGRNWDLGYPQTILRPDGKLFTAYYYTTEENVEQHIAATIWDPDLIVKKY